MQPQFAVLYSAARRLTDSPEDAEDLVQEVCIKAYRKLANLRRMEYPRAWLLRTLYNQFVDGVRHRQRSPVALAYSVDVDDAADLAGPDGMQPEQETERMMKIQMILRAMKLLGKEQAALLAMHDIDGLTLAELQASTGLPLGTIKSKLHRARVKLGQLLQRQDPDAAAMTQTGC